MTDAAAAAVVIRPFRPEDAPLMADLFHASVREAGLRDYSPEQVRAWSPSPPPAERYLRLSPARTVLVALDGDGAPLGYIELEPDGHIDHFYCRPAAVGCGVGFALAEAMEQRAREEGLHNVFVEASEAARRLFLRRGYVELSRNDLRREGVAIHNFNMRKRLTID